MKKQKMLSVALSLALLLGSNMPTVHALQVEVPQITRTPANEELMNKAITGDVSDDTGKKEEKDYNAGLGQDEEAVQQALENLTVEEQVNETSTVENIEAIVPTSRPDGTGDTVIRKNPCHLSKDKEACPPDATVNVCYSTGYGGCMQEKVNNLEYITGDGFAANGDQIARLNGSKAYSLAQISQMNIPRGQKITLALLALLNQQDEQNAIEQENIAAQNAIAVEQNVKAKHEQEVNDKAKRVGKLQEVNSAFTVNGKPANSQDYYLTFVLNPTVPTIDDGSDLTLTIKHNPNKLLLGDYSITVAFQNQMTGKTVKQNVDIESGVPIVLAKKDGKAVGDYTVRVTIHREKTNDINYTLNYRVSQMISTIMSDGRHNTASVASLLASSSINALNGTSKEILGRVEESYWDDDEQVCKLVVKDNETAGASAMIKSRNIAEDDCSSYKNSDKPYVYLDSVSAKIDTNNPEYEDGYVVFEDTSLDVNQLDANEYNAKIDDMDRNIGREASGPMVTQEYTTDGQLIVSERMAGAKGVDFLQVGKTTVPVKYDDKSGSYVLCHANGLPLTEEDKELLSQKIYANVSELEIRKGSDGIPKIILNNQQISKDSYATVDTEVWGKRIERNTTIAQEVAKTARNTTNPNTINGTVIPESKEK